MLVLFFLASICAAAAAVRIARIADPENSSSPLLPLAFLSPLLLLPLLVFGTIGLLNPLPLAGMAACLLIFALAFPKVTRSVASGPPAHNPPTRSALAVAAGMFTGGVLVTAARVALTGPLFGSDELSYHAAYPALWTINGSLAFSAIDYHTYFPLNAELITTWVLLFLRQDALAVVAGFLWLAVLLLSVARIARSLGADAVTTAIVLSLIAVSSVLVTTTRKFASVDLAGPAHLLAAIALIDWAARRENIRAQNTFLLLVGMITGFALGTKVSALPTVFVILLYAALQLVFRPGPGNRWVRALSLMAGVFATGSFWYVRNLIVTGNPIFPAEVGPFAGPFLAEHQARTKLISRLLERGTDVSFLTAVVRQVTNWPHVLAPLALAGLAAGAISLFRGVHTRPKQDQTLRTALVLAAVLQLAAFPFMPFSGGWNRPDSPLDVNPRFLILPFAIGMVLLTCFGASVWRTPVWRAALIGAWLFAVQTDFTRLVPALIAGVLALSPSWDSMRASLWNSLRARWALGATIVFASLCLASPWSQENTNRRLLHSVRQPMGRAWQIVDSLPGGTRIAAFGGSATYPLFGRRLDKVVVPVTHTGKPAEAWHVLFARDPDGTRWWPPPRTAAHSELVRNLRDAGIHMVLLERKRTISWPVEDRALAASATLVHGDSTARIWHVTPESRSGPPPWERPAASPR